MVFPTGQYLGATFFGTLDWLSSASHLIGRSLFSEELIIKLVNQTKVKVRNLLSRTLELTEAQRLHAPASLFLGHPDNDYGDGISGFNLQQATSQHSCGNWLYLWKTPLNKGTLDVISSRITIQLHTCLQHPSIAPLQRARRTLAELPSSNCATFLQKQT